MLLLLLLALVGIWILERTTWYLAIDQFGYLTFARDLAAGRVFHSWSPSEYLGSLLPAGGLASDVLAQTYVRRADGLLYCRYAPGFPLLLAAAVPFGEAAVRSVNLVALLALLVVIFGLGRRLLGSPWHGLAAALLACLLPTYLLLWSISPLRDVPTHLFAFAGLWLSMDAWQARRATRLAIAGVLIGFAASIRFDALLYLLPAAGLAWLGRPWGRRRLAAAVGGVLVGLLPILAYNALATGNPLVPTQFMEAKELLSRGDAAREWILRDLLPGPSQAHAGEPVPRAMRPAEGASVERRLLQGGGLRFRHLGETLPANLALLREIFGDLGLILVGVGVIGAIRRPPLLLFAVPYLFVAVAFFSLWVRADPRYLLGAVLMGVLLLVQGLTVTVALPSRRLGGMALAAAVLAAALFLGGAPGRASSAESALPLVGIALQAALLLGVVVAVWRGRSRAGVAAVAAFALALTGVLIWRSASNLGFRARFQQAEAQRAAETLAKLIDPPALILTRSDIGRPAENINYYTNLDAIYEQELLRWGISPAALVRAAAARGVTTYLLMPPEEVERRIRRRVMRSQFRPEFVARIPASRASEVFVASPQHAGVPLVLVRLHVRSEPGVPPANQGHS